MLKNSPRPCVKLLLRLKSADGYLYLYADETLPSTGEAALRVPLDDIAWFED
jgi:hypothetical protein